jgi:hypothetical protein
MVGGDAEEDLLAEAEETLIADATRLL